MILGDLQRYLNDPSLLPQANLLDLEKLAEEYPYFSIAQILLAKKYQLENHAAAAQQLNKAALTTNDRNWLSDFLNENIFPDTHKKSVSAEQDFAKKEEELSEVLSSNEELHDMLKSIHERKLALLDSGNTTHENGIDAQLLKDSEKEQEIISEVSASQIEYSFLEIEEESAEEQKKESIESESISNIESEMLEQLSYEEREDLLVMNEVAGGGAEFLPTEFTEEEGHEEDFILDQDSELQSLNVIEEEFIARETEFEGQETEMQRVSSLESGGGPETFESESVESDISASEIESESLLEEELIQHESTVSGNEQGIEIESERKEEVAVNGDTNSFRITETVNSPGEFLPEKSYRFSQWLHFFRLNQPPPKIQKEITTKKKEVEEDEKELETFSGSTMQQELESIDKIVSSIHSVPNSTDIVVSAEEMAKKSSEMDAEIVSETLAKIFEAQGHYDKAIRMYVKLSLRFPDKVSFFAARIKELKSKK